MPNDPVVSGFPPNPRSFQAAFARVRPLLGALSESEILSINLDITNAFTTVLGYLPALMSLRAVILATVPGFDIQRYDSLPDCALAMMHAHVQYRNATKPEVPILDLSSQAIAKRDIMLADCNALAMRSLLPVERVYELRPQVGYRPTGELLLSIVDLLRTYWDAIQGKTSVTLVELAEVEALAYDLLSAVGLRAGTQPTVAEAALTRQRAFTLFMNAYDDARRVVIFLRWHHGDADRFAPSLYAGRSNGRKKPEETEEESQASEVRASAGAPPANAQPVVTQGESRPSPTGAGHVPSNDPSSDN
jgi:hypothetical protein